MKLQNKIILFLLLLTSFSIQTSPFTGWDIGANHSILYINDINSFDTRDNVRYLPQKLGPEQIHQYALYVSEYYISKGDKDNLTNLVSLLKSDKNNYESLANFILIFWKMEKGEIADFSLKLDDLITKDENTLYVSIAKFLKSTIQKSELNIETKETIKNLNCSKNKPMYAYCRLMKVSIQMDYLADSSSYPHRDLLNVDRLMAPFFEESELSHVSFLNKFSKDLPSKLAYLGFAYEAVIFQKMITNIQKISGALDPIDHERLSYYQMLSDDLLGAEESLFYVSKKLPALTTNKNYLFLKLGAIAYLRKDYKQSLNYYLELNLKDWDKSMKNPFYDDFISINGARSLISLSLWKSKSAVNAVRALKQLNSESKVTEDSLFIRLRIAQIMMNDKPETAEKISEDILYIAQSKGWKRVEYAATLMNGYCSIISKKYRKATVQFTKSYGIMAGSDPVFNSEWMRSSGILFARIQGRERGNHLASFRSLLHAMRNEEPVDDILGVKNFLDSRFDTEAFFKNAVQFLITTKNYQSLVEFLYYYQKMKVKSPVIANKSLLQLPDVSKRMKQYRAFRPIIDYSYSKSGYSKLRDLEAARIISETETFDPNVLKNIHDPFIAAFSFNEKIYVISYNPETKDKWNYSTHNSIDYRTTGYYNKIYSYLPYLEKANNIQIFMNPIGLDLYQTIKKSNPSLNVRLFYSFTKSNSKKIETDLQPVAVSCDTNTETSSGGIQYFPTDYFEGFKTFTGDDRLHIWNTYDLSSKDSSIENFEWRCKNNSNISFTKMQRRIDLRTTPTAILFSNTIFPKSSLDSISLDYYFWSDFWMRKGVNTLYYVDRMEGDKYPFTDLVNIVTKPANTWDDLGKIQSILKSSNKEILILSKDLK